LWRKKPVKSLIFFKPREKREWFGCTSVFFILLSISTRYWYSSLCNCFVPCLVARKKTGRRNEKKGKLVWICLNIRITYFLDEFKRRSQHLMVPINAPIQHGVESMNRSQRTVRERREVLNLLLGEVQKKRRRRGRGRRGREGGKEKATNILSHVGLSPAPLVLSWEGFFCYFPFARHFHSSPLNSTANFRGSL